MRRMRLSISYLCKAFWLMGFIFACKWCTYIFRMLLWINGIDYGKSVKTGGAAIPMLRISPKANRVSIGNYCSFNNFNDAGWYSKCSIWVKAGASLEIGDNSGMNGVLVYAAEKIIIGQNVKIGGGTRIFDTDFHPIDFLARRHTIDGTKTASVAIEDDVFIGTNCIITKGVTIGARSIVAAGSVVTKSIPANEVWGGNPAKYIKKY